MTLPDMVSFPALGNYGRLGNALFQIAATVEHAMGLGLEPRFPPWPYAKTLGLPAEWFTLPPPMSFDSIELPHDAYLAPWNYEPIPREARVLHGYFQSPRFFPNSGPSIRSMIRRALDISAVPMEIMGVHVRRGDYTRLGRFHTNLSEVYYETALSKVAFRYKLMPIIVSDDPGFCLKAFAGGLISTGSEIGDLCTLAQCWSLVIANSSFSWWGAYLSNASTVIYPKEWFGPELSDHDTSQLVLPEWHWEAV